MEKLGINLGYLIVQILNFVVIFLVVKKWIYDPMLKYLEKRRNTIAEGVENARIASEERANAEQQAQKILAEAQAKAAEVMREATIRADAVAQDIKNAAEGEALKIREAAKAELDKEKGVLLEQLRPEITALALSAAQKIIGESLDEQRQRALLAEFFSGVKANKVVLLEGESISGAEAEVVSALPLTASEKDIVSKDILAKSGAQKVSFLVDPSILGGLVIKVGDRILDGSVSSKLDELKQKVV